MIFPLENLDQVIPASLHILLGVVLLLYNLLLNYCKEIDNEGDNITQQQIQKDLVNQEWEITSLKLEKNEQLMHEHGKNVITMINFQSWMEAVISGDQKENTKLAACGDSSRKLKQKKGRKSAEKCDYELCCITIHDSNVEWVQCDKCDMWFHTECQD